MNNTIEKLVAYLPLFENEPIEEKTDNWWPTYTKYVKDFFNLVRQEFTDRHNALNDHQEMMEQLSSDSYIDQATIDQCRTLMNLILRGEKFSDGWWRTNIQQGKVQAILRRLADLKLQIADGAAPYPDRFKHGPINCRLCFRNSDAETLNLGDWRLKNNPGYSGSDNPEILVLGFSKGATQNKAKENLSFDEVAFSGMRYRLQEIFETLGIMPRDRSIHDLLTQKEKQFGFASLVRCSIYKMVKGKPVTSGPVITSAFKEDSSRHIINNCVGKFLCNLPGNVQLVVILGSSKAYVNHVKAIIIGQYHDYEQINGISFKAGGAVWLFVAHPSPANGHFKSWISGSDDTTSGNNRALAVEGVKFLRENL